VSKMWLPVMAKSKAANNATATLTIEKRLMILEMSAFFFSWAIMFVFMLLDLGIYLVIG